MHNRRWRISTKNIRNSRVKQKAARFSSLDGLCDFSNEFIAIIQSFFVSRPKLLLRVASVDLNVKPTYRRIKARAFSCSWCQAVSVGNWMWLEIRVVPYRLRHVQRNHRGHCHRHLVGFEMVAPFCCPGWKHKTRIIREQIYEVKQIAIKDFTVNNYYSNRNIHQTQYINEMAINTFISYEKHSQQHWKCCR